MPGDTLTMTEAARRLGVSRTTMRRLVREGGVPVAENPLDQRERLIPAWAIRRLEAPRSASPRQFRSDGVASNLAVTSDDIESYLEGHWRPSC